MKYLTNRYVQLSIFLVIAVVCSLAGEPAGALEIAGGTMAVGMALNTEGSGGDASLLGGNAGGDNGGNAGGDDNANGNGGDGNANGGNGNGNGDANTNANGSETPEQKAAREKAEREANETPEQKAEREKREKETYGAPEKYEAFKMPEGVQLDPEGAQALEGLAREFNLSQASAQKLADLGATMLQKWSTQLGEHNAQVRAQWAEQATTDKEFGGEKFKENLGVAAKAMDAFGTPELKEVLNKSGFGNHPELIRFAIRIGKAISEDKLVTGGRAAQGASTTFHYPNSQHT